MSCGIPQFYELWIIHGKYVKVLILTSGHLPVYTWNHPPQHIEHKSDGRPIRNPPPPRHRTLKQIKYN